MISLSMRGSSAFRTGASPESPYIMRQIPDVLVGFDSSKGGHPAQTNSIFYNPEQFAIGVLLHLGRCEIRGARIHPATGVSGLVAVEAMTHCAFRAEEFVSFFDAGLQIRRCWGDTVAAASTNQEAFCSCREKGFEMAGLLKRVGFNLREFYDHHHRTQPEGNKYNDNPALHQLVLTEKLSSEQQGSTATRSAPSARSTTPL
jgi:hypothetical protein